MRRIDHAQSQFPATFSSASSQLWLPSAALSQCVRAVLMRDTRGANLRPAQRYNHIPASPLCALVWYLSGEVQLLEAGYPAAADSPRQVLDPISLCGPTTRPMITANPGEMQVLVLLLFPDAVSLLTGLDTSQLINRSEPALPLLDADWRALCQSVMQAGDDGERLRLIEAFLLPRWQAVRPDSQGLSHYYADWSQNLLARAATSGLGRSLRQMERRIKQWAGLPYRELRGLSRAEQAFFDAAITEPTATVNWSEVASNSGYADQSHLCRQTRRITGFAPEELRRLIFTDEAFWAYRLWGLADQLPD